MARLKAHNLHVSENGGEVVIAWKKNHERRCSSRWLRFNCQCEICRTSLDKTTLDEDILVRKAEISGGDLKCHVSNGKSEDHIASIPIKYLQLTCNCDACIKHELHLRKSTASSPDQSVPYFEYSGLSTDSGLFKCLQLIMERGFCVVRDFPVNDTEIAFNFGRSLGGIRSTLYGHDWYVRSKAKPTNAAFTAVKLPSHQDLQMYEYPPGVQFLLALRFDKSVLGGGSIIVDAIKCAEILRVKHAEHFETLCRVPGTYVTIDMDRQIPAWLRHPKPHIEVGYFGEISAVNWHAGLEATLKIKEKDVDAYYRAHKAFRNIFREERNQISFRLQKGDMLILNNRRVTHARESFQSFQPDDRHLCGFYINMDDLKCRYMTLAHQLGMNIVPSNIGNRSHF